jgi:hypothetical protein
MKISIINEFFKEESHWGLIVAASSLSPLRVKVWFYSTF